MEMGDFSCGDPSPRAAAAAAASGIRFLQKTQTAISKLWRGKNFLAVRISETPFAVFQNLLQQQN